MRETVERLRQTLGEQHPDTLICEGNLAVIMHARGRADDAGLLQQQVVAAMEPVLGAEHPSIDTVSGWRLHNRDLEVQPT